MTISRETTRHTGVQPSTKEKFSPIRHEWCHIPLPMSIFGDSTPVKIEEVLKSRTSLPIWTSTSDDISSRLNSTYANIFIFVLYTLMRDSYIVFYGSTHCSIFIM
ncbi:unnamed protein product [Clavelina lepadiformis]|uniref:Uncharacterized protein n=1 Tax=Clavelina lepadiformis TaxID=159417 RepID=A0ABP0GHE8_CLALP